jgi:hypothetical protein
MILRSIISTGRRVPDLAVRLQKQTLYINIYTNYHGTAFVGTTNTLYMPSACFLKPYGFFAVVKQKLSKTQICTDFNFKDVFFFNMASRSCFICATAPQWARTSSFTRCLDHTQRRTTVGRTPWTSDQPVAVTST